MLRVVFTVLVFFVVSQLNAKILRVGIDYADFNTAHAAAQAGDTLQIYGSQNGTATKRLVIIGFGYNFDVHPGLQAIGTESPSQLGITFNTGSDSSIVEGIDGYIYTYVPKIIVRRCKVSVSLYNSTRSINDVKIISCVLTGCSMVYSNFPCTNLTVYNCVIQTSIGMTAASNGVGSSGAIINCVSTNQVGWAPTLGQANFLIKNCILYSSNSAANPNTVYESNFFQEGQPNPLPQGSNNRWNQTYANLFNRLGGTSDGPNYYGNAAFDENYFILKSGSLAINGGTNSAGNPTDCGIFGGEPIYIYRPSGVPAVPSIYKLTAPSSAATSNPYNVTISVRSNN